MKAIEILKHYINSVAPVVFSPSQIKEAIEELEDYEADMDKYLDYTTGHRCSKSFGCRLVSVEAAHDKTMNEAVEEAIKQTRQNEVMKMEFYDDGQIVYQDGNMERVGTICRHNFPIENNIMNELKFKTGDIIRYGDDEETFKIVAISYDLFKGRVHNYIRYEFENYEFIWVQDESSFNKIEDI